MKIKNTDVVEKSAFRIVEGANYSAIQVHVIIIRLSMQNLHTIIYYEQMSVQKDLRELLYHMNQTDCQSSPLYTEMVAKFIHI